MTVISATIVACKIGPRQFVMLGRWAATPFRLK